MFGVDKSKDVVFDPMDIVKMLSELRSERQRLEEAILAIENRQYGGSKVDDGRTEAALGRSS